MTFNYGRSRIGDAILKLKSYLIIVFNSNHCSAILIVDETSSLVVYANPM